MKGRMISPGKAKGIAIVSNEPIGFYGGIDSKTGFVIEEGHPLEGRCIKDKILVFPCGKGSTVGSYVIYGLKKNGVAPRGIINEETETIVATGVILAGITAGFGMGVKAYNESNGVDSEKMEALKNTVIPDYDRSKDLIINMNPDGRSGTYINAAYINPFSVIFTLKLVYGSSKLIHLRNQLSYLSSPCLNV